jgi:hypothetical protein
MTNPEFTNLQFFGFVWVLWGSSDLSDSYTESRILEANLTYVRFINETCLTYLE